MIAPTAEASAPSTAAGVLEPEFEVGDPDILVQDVGVPERRTLVTAAFATVFWGLPDVPAGKEPTMSTHTQPCEHSMCQCVVTGAVEGAAYCSDVCQSRDTDDEEMASGCECGHSPCDAD
jgi:hypothetical protein